MPTIKQLETRFMHELADLYPPDEIRSIFLWIAESVLNMRGIDIRLDINQMAPTEQIRLFDAYLVQLQQGIPVQYVLKHAWFCGRRFTVTPDVLIPRPETEELVHLIHKTNTRTDPHILDIGTGSGCIPITLKKLIPAAQVSAWDISEAALAIARTNAHDHQATIGFKQVDILSNPIKRDIVWDVIVSNPPYVTQAEKDTMRRHVVDFEPAVALFVDDEDPLLFYRAIAKFAMASLAENGWLYFEINQQYGPAIKELLLSLGFQAVQIYTDMQGHDRMIAAQYPISQTS